LTPNELVLTFGGLHLCVKFGENRLRNATVRVMTHGQTDRHTDTQTHRQAQTDFIICPIAICYSYGADKNEQGLRVIGAVTLYRKLNRCWHQDLFTLYPVHCPNFETPVES